MSQNTDIAADFNLLHKIEIAEQSRELFDAQFSPMQRALAFNLYSKAELFSWLKQKGFGLSEETFLKWWTRKTLQAKKASKK